MVHEARTREKGNVQGVWWGNLRDTDNLEDLDRDLDGRIIISGS